MPALIHALSSATLQLPRFLWRAMSALAPSLLRAFPACWRAMSLISRTTPWTMPYSDLPEWPAMSLLLRGRARVCSCHGRCSRGAFAFLKACHVSLTLMREDEKVWNDLLADGTPCPRVRLDAVASRAAWRGSASGEVVVVHCRSMGKESVAGR